MLSEMHLIAEPRRLITPTTIENCFVSVVSQFIMSAAMMKLTENEEDDWRSLQPLRVQSKDCRACDSAFEVCGIRSVDQVLDQHLIKAEKEPEEEEEVAEHKGTFMGALKGLEGARKYIHQFDTKNTITVMCTKVEN
jgi:hypothetical protein